MFKPVCDLGKIVRFLALTLVFGAGCGGASTTAGAGQPASDGAFADSEKAKEDPKVKEASSRCEKEIADSELQPPDSLEPIQVRACLHGIKPKITACSQGIKRELTLKIVIEKTGKVLNAFPVGETADCLEAKCVADAVKTVVFPKFKGQTQQIIKYPFILGE